VVDNPDPIDGCDCHACRWSEAFFGGTWISCGANDPTRNFQILSRGTGMKYGYFGCLKEMTQDEIRISIALATEGVE